MEPKVARDNGGRRSGLTRREFSYSSHIPERRAAGERRSGYDRRSGTDRRRTFPLLMAVQSQTGQRLEPGLA
jgi:hypothetical protein